MRAPTTALALFAAPQAALAVLPSPGQPGSHGAYWRSVESAEIHAFEDAVASYDAFLRSHPKNAVAAVERCELLAVEAAAHEDDDSRSDDDRDAFGDCLEDLGRDYPDSRVAVLYRLDHKWSDEAITFAKDALANHRIRWTDRERASIYAKLSQSYTVKRQVASAGLYARLAMDLDPQLDLSRDVAAKLLAEGRPTEAVVVLSGHTDGRGYELAQKARMLADASAYGRAAWMIDLASAKSTLAVDSMLRARVLDRSGQIELARKAYAEERLPANRVEALTRIFEIDLAGTDRVAAAQSYHALRAAGWETDPLGRRRLALAWRFPRAKWELADLSGILVCLACVAGLALIPGFFLVPLHSWSLRRRLRAGVAQEPQPAPLWGFRHAWLATAALFVVQFVALYAFCYDGLASLLTNEMKSVCTPRALAAFGASYALLLVAFLALVLFRRRTRLRLLGPGAWSVRKSAAQALVAVVINFGAAFLASVLFGAFGTNPFAPGEIGIDAIVTATITSYGLVAALLVYAVLIPIAEEVIFRSALLDVLGTHLRFWIANAVQAFAFAALHGNPARLVFYFVFGAMAGRMRRASGGLLPGILMHAVNNAIVIVVLAATSASSSARPPPRLAPDAELAACTASAPDLPELRALRISTASLSAIVSQGNPTPTVVNTAAWGIAIDPSASRACLAKAEHALDEALRWAPERPAFLDTEATVWFRQGRVDDAIDLERGVVAMGGEPFRFSQLDRFIAARQAGDAPLLLGGAGCAPKIVLGPRAANGDRTIVLESSEPFSNGVEVYARISRGDERIAFMRLAAGAAHERSVRIQVPKQSVEIPDDARIEVALVDARGCAACSRPGWRWTVERHDKAVDSLP